MESGDVRVVINEANDWFRVQLVACESGDEMRTRCVGRVRSCLERPRAV